jgi:hypothetical protein
MPIATAQAKRVSMGSIELKLNAKWLKVSMCAIFYRCELDDD